MTLDLPDEHVAMIVRALGHYHAYLKATGRDDWRYTQIAERLQRKPPEPETATPVKKKRA